MRVSENLLSITRIDGENAGVKKTPELVEEIIEGAVSKFRRHYKGITVQVHLPEEPMLVPMDPLLMQQVLFNLMENAARHGETVTQIDISLSQKDEWAILDVADNGVGLAVAGWSICLMGRSTRRRAARTPGGIWASAARSAELS